MIVIDDTDFAHQIAGAAGYIYNPDADHSLARLDGAGRLLGGVIFEGFNGKSIGMHAAGFAPRWMNRNFMFLAFHYPFEQLKVAKIFLQVSTGNPKSLEFAAGLGFKEAARLSDAFMDGDAVILEMARGDCRWLDLQVRVNLVEIEKVSHGKEIGTGSRS